MGRTFKKMRGCSLSYNRQGYIYFVCKNFASQPMHIKAKIRRLCDEVGGEYSPALFRVLTTSTGVRKAAMDGYLSERLLYELRKKFYEMW